MMAVSNLTNVPEQGNIVTVRQPRYVVTTIEAWLNSCRTPRTELETATRQES
jgi:hypothetical protein